MSDRPAVFSNALVGVDGRQGGRDAIALARLLVAPTGRLTLANVYRGTVPAAGAWVEAAESAAVMEQGGAEVPRVPPLDTVERKESEELLERERIATSVQAELVSEGPSSVGRALHELVEQRGNDLLVVGSCHRGLLGRVLLGNDTRVSLNGASCAVAIAPLSFAGEPPRTIGVGYDGSAESQAALAVAREQARSHGATVRVCKVVGLMSSAYAGIGGVVWGSALEAMLAEGQRQLAALEDVSGEAVIGTPGEELAIFSGRVDLLVVGSRSYGPLRRLMLGSTSHYLAGHARCPVLVLPRGVGEMAPAGAG